MISDGDIAGSIMAAMPDTGVDLLLGVGGSPEAVTSACALKCLGGDLQCKLWPRNEGVLATAVRLACFTPFSSRSCSIRSGAN